MTPICTAAAILVLQLATITFAKDQFPMMIILQTDNHNYLSRITKARKEPIMAAKPTPNVHREFRMIKE